MQYWEARKHHKYYQVVKKWLEDLGPLNTLIDVGSEDTPVALYGDFEKRVALSVWDVPQIDGADCFKCDWMDYETDQVDVITCLQVIEHFETNYLHDFVAKILRESKTAIISVPYMWPEGACEYHKQDPIDVRKLLDLMGRDPVRMQIVTDGKCSRIVAMFQGDESTAV